MVAFSVAKLTVALLIPSIGFKADSMVSTHDAQCIPVIFNVSFLLTIISSFLCYNLLTLNFKLT